MTKKFLYGALAGISLMFAGCSEELTNESTLAVEKHTGEEISFGGSASFNVNGEEGAGTRTIYGGYVEGAAAEPVYWTEGDDVRVYCPEGAIKMSDYDVDVTGDKVVITSLSRRGDYSLQWGNTNQEHNFYAVYPAPSSVAENKDLNGVTTIEGTIPATQNYSTYTKDGYNHIFSPNMDYAYMVAKTVVPEPNAIGENVYLKFSPIATAVEITLMNNTGRDLNLNRVFCSSATQNIAGSFSADLSQMSVTAEGNVRYGTGYPTTSIVDGTGVKQIEIPLLSNDNSTTLKIGESVTFTVFMLPTADITDLVLNIQAVEGSTVGYKTGTFNGITIQQKKKTYLRNISVSGKPYTQAEWIKYVADTEKLTALSIPAAGGAASGYTTAGAYNVADAIRQQNYDIPALWNMGVRCFEFAVDISSSDLIGQCNVLSGGASCGITLGDAITEVVEMLVAHPKEFAMVILTYQTLNGWAGMENVTRAPATFMTQVNTLWTKTQEGLAAASSLCSTALYSPTMTVNDARGKLFCIARPTSIYEDYGEVQIQTTGYRYEGTSSLQTIQLSTLGVPAPHEHIMVIQGWGSLKDKWQQRGFSKYSVRKTNSTGSDSKPGRPFDVSEMDVDRKWESGIINPVYTYYLDGNIPVPSNYTITPGNLTPDFSYDTQSSSSTTTDGAWVQEWARVSNHETVKWFEFSEGATYESMNNPSSETYKQTAKTAYWAPSYVEKCTRVEETLNKAIGRGATDATIYINSLCGYYISDDIAESYYPCVLTDRNINNENKTLSTSSRTAGMSGNIQDFASDMNNNFNTLLQDKTTNTNVGPIGIIMMDRVGESESSQRIPQIIIANNFQFALNPNLDLTKGGNVKQEDVVLSREQNRGTKTTAPIITWE